jgi:hypothetical protein
MHLAVPKREASIFINSRPIDWHLFTSGRGLPEVHPPYFVSFIYSVLLKWASIQRNSQMDEKTLTAVSTSLALMQFQVNALLLLLERHTPGVSIKEEFQQLISEGV